MNFLQTASDTPGVTRVQPSTGNMIGSLAGSYDFLNGLIHEVIVYNTALTTPQRQQIEGYLAWKWDLRASMPATHPFRSILPSFLPTQVSGCALWLDAADSSSMTLSGSNVTQWNDKSGNGRHATAQSAASYSAADNALRFTSGNYYSFASLSFAINSYFSLFIVERLQNTSSMPHVLGTDSDGNNQSLHIRYNGTPNGSTNASAFRFAFYNNDLDAQNIPAFTTAAAQPIRVWSLVFTTSFRGIYLNGTIIAAEAAKVRVIVW
jgi:hypothetical protein